MSNEPLWQDYDPVQYVEKNYRKMNSQDLVVLANLMDWYKKNKGQYHLEIGCGPNMYPLLAAIPFFEKIYAADISGKNLNYVTDQLDKLSPIWLPYLRILKDYGAEHYNFSFTKSVLEHKIQPIELSIFDIEPESWDSISMHFVAESISKSRRDFFKACNCMAAGLKPGGKMTAAFMENSESAKYGDIEFKTVSVDVDDVAKAFDGINTRVVSIPYITPIRPGYTGIIVCNGYKP